MEKLPNQRQQKIYINKILRVLNEQNFIINNDEITQIKEKTSNGRRYFFMVLKRNENGVIVDRFVKIPQNNSKKLLEPFARQIEISLYLKKHTDIKTRGVINYNYNPKNGIPFVIMETFPKSHSKIGFIEGNNGTELLGSVEAKNVIVDLIKFHDIKFDTLPKNLQEIIKTKNRGDGYSYIKKSVNNAFAKKIFPLDAKNNKTELLHSLLERRLGIDNFKKKINNLIDKIEPLAEEKMNQGNFIVHGDMAPNNLYIFDDGKVEFLDFEWVSRFSNRLVAMVYDFGNLRARSWKNKLFRDELDRNLLEIYRSKDEEVMGKAIICLSILRSNIRFSGYFENYPWEKQKLIEETQRRKIAEEELQKIWEFGF